MAIRLFLAVVAKSWKHCATRVFRSRWFRVSPSFWLLAYLGIPLTHRDYAQSVRLITVDETGGELDWKNLCSKTDAGVLYGANQAATIQKLIEHGMPGEMPVAIVENGTAVTQRVIDGTLNTTGRTGAANEQSIANYYWSGLLACAIN